jgi:hypothetical protein
LRILAKLRKLDLKFDDMIQDIAKYIDAENDYFFIKGKETEQTKFVKNLLTESDFTIDKIANIAGVSIDFVKSVKQKLIDKK